MVDGTSNKTEAKPGEKVELKAEKTKDGKKFDKWVSDDVVITNSNSRTEDKLYYDRIKQ